MSPAEVNENNVVVCFKRMYRKKDSGAIVIKDYNNELILGSFYETQLVKVTSPKDDTYRIEKILKRRKAPDGTKEVLVKWYGYHRSISSWIKESKFN